MEWSEGMQDVINDKLIQMNAHLMKAEERLNDYFEDAILVVSRVHQVLLVIQPDHYLLTPTIKDKIFRVI